MDPALTFDLTQYFTPEDLTRGHDRWLLANSIAFTEVAVELFVLWALTFSRAGTSLWNRCVRWTGGGTPGPFDRVLGPEWRAAGLFLLLGESLAFAASFPGTFARTFWVAHAYGISTEGLASFFRRQAINLSFGATTLAILGPVLGGARRRWPGRWWLAVGVSAAVLIVADAVIEPLWQNVNYSVQPMADGPLRQRLQTFLSAQHVEVGELMVIDASRYGSGVDAFVTGFGPTRRLVLTDTLVAFGEEAVLGAVGHEIGHRRGERLPGRLALAAATMVLLLWLVECAFRFTIARGARHEAQALPFVIASLALVFLAVLPLRTAFIRSEEREADAVELSLRRDYDAYIQEQVRLVRSNALDPLPSPFARLLGDHPCAAERIGRALEYKARATRGSGL